MYIYNEIKFGNYNFAQKKKTKHRRRPKTRPKKKKKIIHIIYISLRIEMLPNHMLVGNRIKIIQWVIFV